MSLGPQPLFYHLIRGPLQCSSTTRKRSISEHFVFLTLKWLIETLHWSNKCNTFILIFLPDAWQCCSYFSHLTKKWKKKYISVCTLVLNSANLFSQLITYSNLAQACCCSWWSQWSDSDYITCPQPPPYSQSLPLQTAGSSYSVQKRGQQ